MHVLCVDVQIRVLESQLAQLKGQAAEVEDKRARLQQQQAKALEALGASTGRKLPVSLLQLYMCKGVLAKPSCDTQPLVGR